MTKPFCPDPIAGTLPYAVDGQTFGVTLKLGWYSNNRPALTLESIHGRVAVATVNLPDVDLADGYLHIKTWGGNENMLSFLVANGIVEDTGIDVDTGAGFVTARLVRKGPNFPTDSASLKFPRSKG